MEEERTELKIIDLKCPACGGHMKPQKDHPKTMICEYCGSQYQMDPEPEKTVNVQIHSNPSAGNTDKQIWPRIVLSGIAFLVGSMVWGLISGGSSKNSSSKPDLPAYSYDYGYETQPETEERDSEVHSSLYTAFVEAVFQKDAELVTEEELKTITYLSIRSDSEESVIEYGFGDPYQDAFETETLRFTWMPWENSDFSSLTGLIKADLREQDPDADALCDLKELKGLSVYKMDFSEIEELLPFPEQLIELEVDSPDSLAGVSAFENLEILSVRNIFAPDFRELVPLAHLKAVEIEEKDGEGSLTDYTAFASMSELTALQIESEGIRDLGFLRSLKDLEYLSLAKTDVLSLEPLAELSALSVLELEDNGSVEDYGPVGQLTGLKELTINKNTSAKDPDLSGLTSLERLDICGFMSLSSLMNMSQLKDLSVHGCNLDGIGSLSTLSGLERLTCYSVWSSSGPLREVSFIDGMTNLKHLDFYGLDRDEIWGAFDRGIEIFGDISNAFNHPGLETLILNEGTFEIDFKKLSENPSLKHLEMKNVYLEENFYVESYAGMTDAWFDDVSFDEHKEFLMNYPGLEVLYLDGNQLTDIQFVTALKNLTHLGIQDNYVTDLSALNQLEKLQYLDIRMNPISKGVDANENVRILE